MLLSSCVLSLTRNAHTTIRSRSRTSTVYGKFYHHHISISKATESYKENSRKLLGNLNGKNWKFKIRNALHTLKKYLRL